MLVCGCRCSQIHSLNHALELSESLHGIFGLETIWLDRSIATHRCHNACVVYVCLLLYGFNHHHVYVYVYVYAYLYVHVYVYVYVYAYACVYVYMDVDVDLYIL